MMRWFSLDHSAKPWRYTCRVRRDSIAAVQPGHADVVRRVGGALVGVAVVVTICLAAAGRPTPRPAGPGPVAVPNPGPLIAIRPPSGQTSVVWVWIGLVALGVAGVVIAVALFRWGSRAWKRAIERRVDAPRSGQRSESSGVPMSGGVTTAAAAGMRAAMTAQVDLDGEPRDQVVACWVAVEAQANRTGDGRRAVETVGEFTRRVMAGFADREAVDVLVRLYQRARYSSAPLSPVDRADAQGALRRLLGVGSWR